jgi:hypothetical protein
MIYIYTDTLTHKPDHRPTNKATNMGLSPGDWRAIGVSEEGESFAAMGGGGMGGVWGGSRRSRSLAGAFAWRKSCGGLLSMFVSFFFWRRLAQYVL